jgi:ribosomal protein L40E
MMTKIVFEAGRRRIIILVYHLVYLSNSISSFQGYFKLLLVPQTTPVPAMPDGTNDDTLRVVAEKLKRLTDETQEQYEAFIDATQLYKKGNVNQKDFLAKISDYLIGMTSLNFIAIQVLFEVKSAIQTNLSERQSQVSPLFKSHHETLGGGTIDRKTNDIVVDTTPTKSHSNQEKFLKVKNCIICGSTIPTHAKFCNKCGNSQ